MLNGYGEQENARRFLAYMRLPLIGDGILSFRVGARGPSELVGHDRGRGRSDCF